MSNFSFSDILADLNRQQAAKHRAAQALKPKVFQALAAAGAATVTVPFDGGGDDGQIGEIKARGADGKTAVNLESIPFPQTGLQPDASDANANTLERAIENLCYDLLEESHGGWEINEGSYGRFTFTVSTRHIKLDFNQRVDSVDSWEEEY